MDTKDLGVMIGGVAAVMGLAYARSKMSGSLSESAPLPKRPVKSYVVYDEEWHEEPEYYETPVLPRLESRVREGIYGDNRDYATDPEVVKALQRGEWTRPDVMASSSRFGKAKTGL